MISLPIIFIYSLPKMNFRTIITGTVDSRQGGNLGPRLLYCSRNHPILSTPMRCADRFTDPYAPFMQERIRNNSRDIMVNYATWRGNFG